MVEYIVLNSDSVKSAVSSLARAKKIALQLERKYNTNYTVAKTIKR